MTAGPVIADHMRAVILDRYGPPERVLRPARGPVPVPRRGQVLVRVRAASVNSWDVDLVTGPPIIRVAAPFRPRRRIIGADVSGEVVAVGEEVMRFSIGDRVAGDLSASGWGGFAEYVAVDERALTGVPDAVAHSVACALPQAGGMAVQALGERDELAGRRVLIVGAGGGVGTFAVQLAHAAGAHVTVVDRQPKLAALRRLGADEAIEAGRLGEVSHPSFDRVVDVIGALSVASARRLMAAGGTSITVGGRPGLLLRILVGGLLGADRRGRRVGLLIARPNRDLPELLGLVASGALTVVADGPHALSEVPHQVERLRAGDVTGKLIVVPA